jgi:hypothetical protein
MALQQQRMVEKVGRVELLYFFGDEYDMADTISSFCAGPERLPMGASVHTHGNNKIHAYQLSPRQSPGNRCTPLWMAAL